MLRRSLVLFVLIVVLGPSRWVARATTLALLKADTFDPTAALAATGRFSSITTFSALGPLPSLATLSAYDAVLAWTNFVPSSPVAMGNLLADYVDLGGKRLVLATYAYSNPWAVTGRIITGNYVGLTNVGSNGDVSGLLVAVVPGDPIFTGINLATVTYFHNSNFAHPGVAAGATLLATDGSGHNMIARSANGVVDINLFPGFGPGFGNNAEFFDLLANALGAGAVAACPHHRVHGHIDTVPPGHHNGVVAGIHHGQHGHLVTPGAECPPHAPFHSPGLTAETAGEGLFSTNAVGQEATFVAGLNQDGTLNGNPSAAGMPGAKVLPAHRGTVVQLFGSAGGLFLDERDLRAASGFTPPVSGSPLFYTTSLPEVRIGGIAAQVLFSGLAPGLTGVWQINVLIPDGAPAGSAPVTINYEGDELTSVNLSVE